MHDFVFELDSTIQQNVTVIWNGIFHSNYKLMPGNNKILINLTNWQEVNDLRIYFLENTGIVEAKDIIYQGLSLVTATKKLCLYEMFDTYYIGKNGQDGKYFLNVGHTIEQIGYFNIKITYPFDKWFYKKWQKTIEREYDTI